MDRETMSANKIITPVNLHKSHIIITDNKLINIDVLEDLLDEEGFKDIRTETLAVKSITLNKIINLLSLHSNKNPLNHLKKKILTEAGQAWTWEALVYA